MTERTFAPEDRYYCRERGFTSYTAHPSHTAAVAYGARHYDHPETGTRSTRWHLELHTETGYLRTRWAHTPAASRGWVRLLTIHGPRTSDTENRAHHYALQVTR